MGKKKSKSFFDRVKGVVENDKFFLFVIIISILQNLWYALTFRPIIFDETIHFGSTQAYLGRLSPFITNQPKSLDYLGEVTRNTSYLYYYLMSWPLRVINLFTHNLSAQLILLRLINVALFATALVVYRKVFIKAGAPKSLIHLSLFFLVLSPIFAILGGAVNYDNAVFLLSGLVLLLAVGQMQSKTISFQRLSLIAIIGLLGTLIKFEFLALFVPLVIFLILDLWQRHGQKAFKQVGDSFIKTSTLTKTVLIVGLVLSSILFIEMPVLNVVKYHSLSPTCVQILGRDRCMSNYTARRDIDARAVKPANFVAANPFNYVLQMWIPGMITSQTVLLPHQTPSPILRLLYYIATLGGLVLVIAYLRDLIKNNVYKMLTYVTVAYVLILTATLYKGYVELGQPIAISARYLLPVAPIFILFVGISLVRMLSKHPRTMLTILFVTVLLFSQGGGMISYLLAPNTSTYWYNSLVIHSNTFLRDNISKFVHD